MTNHRRRTEGTTSITNWALPPAFQSKAESSGCRSAGQSANSRGEGVWLAAAQSTCISRALGSRAQKTRGCYFLSPPLCYSFTKGFIPRASTYNNHPFLLMYGVDNPPLERTSVFGSK